MIELTQLQYQHIFNSSNHDPMFRTLVRQWSDRHGQTVTVHTRTNLPVSLQYPVLYRDQLPTKAERILALNELKGVVYTGGWAKVA